MGCEPPMNQKVARSHTLGADSSFGNALAAILGVGGAAEPPLSGRGEVARVSSRDALSAALDAQPVGSSYAQLSLCNVFVLNVSFFLCVS